ncbi:MAG: hypothetical protein O2964_15415, partial [Verrucomicrobia bacterium]|nr:hypothetical protein [Verrucomicrobiota bacterium]
MKRKIKWKDLKRAGLIIYTDCQKYVRITARCCFLFSRPLRQGRSGAEFFLKLLLANVISKPFSEAEVHARVNTHLRVGRLTRALQERNIALEKAIQERKQAERATANLTRQLEIIADQDADCWGYAGIIGDSQQFAAILKQVQLLQKSERTSTLVTGESG